MNSDFVTKLKIDELSVPCGQVPADDSMNRVILNNIDFQVNEISDKVLENLWDSISRGRINITIDIPKNKVWNDYDDQMIKLVAEHIRKELPYYKVDIIKHENDWTSKITKFFDPLISDFALKFTLCN